MGLEALQSGVTLVALLADVALVDLHNSLVFFLLPAIPRKNDKNTKIVQLHRVHCCAILRLIFFLKQ